MKLPTTHQRGAVAAETAIVLVVLFLLFIAFYVGGMIVFRHQQVASLAREGARWASVRGADYTLDTLSDGVSAAQIREAGVLPFAAGMDPANVTVDVEWIDKSTGTAHAWDSVRRDVRSITHGGEYVSNTVRVTVTYTWSSGFFGEPHVQQSRCEMPMTH